MAAYPLLVLLIVDGYALGEPLRKEERVHGYSDDKQAYVKRLRRIEGQVRGLQRMVDEDAYCVDILTQVSAVTRALQAVALGLLDGHVRHCVADAMAGDDRDAAVEKMSEAMAAVERLVRA